MGKDIKKIDTIELPERNEIALRAHNKVISGFVEMAEGLTDIYEFELWRDLGATSFTDYITTMADVSKSHAFRCLRAHKVMKLASKSEKSSATVALLSWRDLGVVKMDKLSKVDDDLLKELFDGGSVSIENGEQFDISDIASMKVRDVELMVADITKIERSKRHRAEEKSKLSSSQLSTAKSEIDELKKRIEKFYDSEIRYRGLCETHDNKMRALTLARQSLIAAGGYIQNAHIVDGEDEQSLVEELKIIHKDMHRIAREFVFTCGEGAFL